MSEIMISNEAMQYINIASNMLKVDILDCIVADNDWLVFIVKKGQLGKAIGSNAKNLEKLKKVFKKNVKFVEFDKDKKKFVVNLFKPYNVKDVDLQEKNDSSVAVVKVDAKDKSKAIGKGGRNIEVIRQLADRHHSINDVQIK